MKISSLQFLSITLALLTIACTPKVQEEIVPKEEITEVVKPVIDNNPCVTLDELSPGDKDSAETAYVLFKDQIDQGNYTEAFDYWEKAYYAAPAANGSIKYQFEDGIKIYKHFYDNATDDKLKQSYVDSVMSIYNKRIECYGDADYIAGRKAFDAYYYYSAHTQESETFELFKQATDGKKEKTDYFVINPFTKLVSDKVVSGKMDLDEGRHYIDLLLDAIEYGNNSGKNAKAWEIINAYAPARLENLEGMEGLYDCAYYEKKYMALFHADNTDCDMINKTYRRLMWGGCDKDAGYVQEVVNAKRANCYTPPPPDGPLKKAFNAYTEGQYKEAIRLFDEFVEKTSDMDKKFKYTMMVAKIYYGDIKNFSSSRKYARAASKLKPTSGEPALLIGKLYASSGPLCGPGTGWDSQIVTWPALDKFKEAKKDPVVSAEAQEFIKTYQKYMPSKEDIFLRGIKTGTSFKVGCWIQEKTTVRTAD